MMEKPKMPLQQDSDAIKAKTALAKVVADADAVIAALKEREK